MMKKILAALLALALLCGSLPVLAEGNEAVTVEAGTGRTPVYAADDPYIAAFRTGTQEADALPVLLLAEGKNLQLQVTVQPRTVRNKKVVLSSDNEEAVVVRGYTLAALKAGEAVLTVASEQDPAAAVQYRVIVYKPVSRITLTAPERTVTAGQSVALTAEFMPEDAAVRQAVWSVSDERIASVDENGTVTGLKRGNVSVTAAAADGSSVRANCYIQVIQDAEEIRLDQEEMTLNTGRSAVLRATVLPADTNDKGVVWATSDEGIAQVNGYGQVTGIEPGTCEITCADKKTGSVRAKTTVHVQRPVSRIIFLDAPAVYINETGKLRWNIEPADATNQALTFMSGNEGVAKVDADGTVTGVRLGGAYITAVAADGTNRRAQLKVNILQHLTGVRMQRKTAYIDVGEGAITGAVLEPEKYINRNMTWESADPSVAKAEAAPGRSDRVRITGVQKGETTVTGTTEDGGLQASMTVKIGDYSHAVRISSASISGKGRILLKVKNVSSDLYLNNIVAEIEAFDSKGKPVAINKKNGSNKIRAVYGKTLLPGQTTATDRWQFRDLDKSAGFRRMTVRILEYQINGEWVKTLRSSVRPVYRYTPGKKKKK